MSRRTLGERRVPLLEQQLTDQATIAWSHSSGESAHVTLTASRSIGAATGQRSGNISVLRVIQDGTGGWSLTWDSTYKFPADGAPVLSKAANAVDTFIFVSDGTNLHCINAQKRGLAPRGYIDGLVMSDTATDRISVAAGEATMIESTTGETRVLGTNASAFVKLADADWAEGTGNGGIATGARAVADTLNASTWYHFFMIGETDGNIDFGYDTSTTAANLLSDASTYTFYRRLGSILSTAGSLVTGFHQVGDWFMWDVPTEDFDVSANDHQPHGAGVTLSVPTGFEIPAIIMVSSAAGSDYVYASANTGEAADSRTTAGATVGVHSLHFGTVLTSTAARVEIYGSDTSVDSLVMTLGWIDPRGRG